MVVAQPDKPAGRGLRVTAPPVAERAREVGLELWQPTRLRSDEAFLARIAELSPDVGVTAAYGRILPPRLLDIPVHGVLNVHASLLPNLRGAAPVQWALIRGEAETGVSIMQTEEGLDTGPVRLQRRTAIAPAEDAGQLATRLAKMGAEALTEALDLLAEGTLPLVPQDDALATQAPMLTAEDGHVRWQDTARQVYDRHRGVSVWPGTSFAWGDGRVKVTELSAVEDEAADLRAPGTVLSLGPDGILVATGNGSVRLGRVKPAGGRDMPARDWANGRGVKPGARLG